MSNQNLHVGTVTVRGVEKQVVLDPMYTVKDKPLDKMHVHLSSGNSKIGKIINISTIPGDAVHYPKINDKEYEKELKEAGFKGKALQDAKRLIKLCDEAGTCPGVCNECSQYCYAFDSAVQYHTSCIPSWGENTRLIREDPDRFFKEVSEYFDHHTIEEFRINVSGELERYDWLEKWTTLAEKHPDVRFGIYTKRFAFVNNYLDIHNSFPANFFLNASEWNGNLDRYKSLLEGKVNFFAYADTLAKLLEYIKQGYKVCKAINYKGQHTGTKCSECGYCYGRYGVMKSAVLDHSAAGRVRLAQEIKELKKRGELESVVAQIWGPEEGARLLGE